MIQFKSKFYKAVLIIYSLLSIASTAYLLFRPSDAASADELKDTRKELQHIKEYIKEQDAQYHQTVDSLKAKSDSLQSVITITQKRLKYSRMQVTTLSNQLNDYIHSYETDTSLKKDNLAFDSLADMSKEYLIVSHARDSLCDSQLNSLQELVEVKDSIIRSDDTLVAHYKSAIDQLQLSANKLADELKQTNKKLTRKTRLNRVLSVGTIFLTGFILAKTL